MASNNSDVNGYRIRTSLEQDLDELLMDKFCKIDEHLYLGSYQSVMQIMQKSAQDKVCFINSQQTMDSNNSQTSDQDPLLHGSALLTIDNQELPTEITDLCSDYMYLKAEDSLQNDMIKHFDECSDFIEKHRSDGRTVFVHCNAGMSRSASVVAAYLMKKHKIQFNVALAKIREVRSIAMPNSNFLNQLRLYQLMGNRVDLLNPLYRQFRLGLLSQSGVPEKQLDSYLASLPNNASSTADVFYCRMCRCPLFSAKNMLTHPAKALDQEDLIQSNSIKVPVCSQGEIFIEPVVWMKEEISKLEGKMNCYKCCKKVGTFSWIGEKCSCGVFVTPSFRMDKGKVEIRKQLKQPN